MNKLELVKATAEKSGLPQAVVTQAIDGALEVITDTLAMGENVGVKGFGTLKVTHVDAREMHLPTFDGVVPAHNKVTFSVGSQLKEAVQ